MTKKKSLIDSLLDMIFPPKKRSRASKTAKKSAKAGVKHAKSRSYSVHAGPAVVRSDPGKKKRRKK